MPSKKYSAGSVIFLRLVGQVCICADIETGLSSLRQLRELRHLDISQCDESRGHFKVGYMIHGIISNI
jgi:hypothetical protein